MGRPIRESEPVTWGRKRTLLGNDMKMTEFMIHLKNWDEPMCLTNGGNRRDLLLYRSMLPSQMMGNMKKIRTGKKKAKDRCAHTMFDLCGRGKRQELGNVTR